MFSQLTKLISQGRPTLNRLHLPLTGLFLTVGVAASGAFFQAAKAQQQVQNSDSVVVAAVPVATSSKAIANGTYLYGQTPQPEQIGQEYLVFEANGGNVVGAMYLPGSEFSCFYGTLQSEKMDLTMVNPYDQTAVSHTIALNQPTEVAYAGNQLRTQDSYDSVTYPHSVQLEGYTPISQVSENDQRLLNTCKASYQ
ncbi:MAG: hypothetical protein KME06_04835 [Kastovskya adunca ATA6-11-RM4]|nr:hypothetical protein [Kastovskya adunca ATA6-11-RM4]